MEERTPNGCVVLTAPLTSAIRAFVERWDRENEEDDPWMPERISGMAWLSLESGLSEDVLWNIRGARFRTTELSTADRIVHALGHEEWFHDGTLTVLPNPRASRELRESCCGGLSDVPPLVAPVAA